MLTYGVMCYGGWTADWPDDEPWCLVVDDVTKPAFMQPPVIDRKRAQDFSKKPTDIIETPDELDVLVTSKNHVVKSSIAKQCGVDDWIFALVSLQTMGGYDAPNTYGISRMPSGYGNRSAFSLTPSLRFGVHFQYDVRVLLRNIESVLDEYPMVDNGIKLLWLEPWDGMAHESFLLNALHPYYVEICRRIRFGFYDGKLTVYRATSKARRIQDMQGLTGDPWMPVDIGNKPDKTPAAFLNGNAKFGYERIVDGLFSSDWKWPMLLSHRGYAENMYLVARGMVRGQGGTEGYHERIVPLQRQTIQMFGIQARIKKIEDIARERISQISDVEKALKGTIRHFAFDGTVNWDLVNGFQKQLNDIVDVDFFVDLQQEVNSDDDKKSDVRFQWLRKLVNNAEKVLDDAIIVIIRSEAKRLKARVMAKDWLNGGIRKAIPDLYDGG